MRCPQTTNEIVLHGIMLGVTGVQEGSTITLDDVVAGGICGTGGEDLGHFHRRVWP
jgi:hypothetical protein